MIAGWASSPGPIARRTGLGEHAPRTAPLGGELDHMQAGPIGIDCHGACNVTTPDLLTTESARLNTRMPYLRFSRARYPYVCASCAEPISRGQQYFRDEPHPYARMRFTPGREAAITRHHCLVCVLGSERAASLTASAQLPLGFELTRNGFLKFPPRVELVELTPRIIRLLADDPEYLFRLSPPSFEDLICNRLDAMGFDVQRVGHTYRKDGGVDIFAWQRTSPLPCLMAVQVKHVRDNSTRIGPSIVRDFSGAVRTHGFNAGLLVTNTTFTPDAAWFAAQQPLLLRLRDMADLQRWLREEYLQEQDWRELPRTIELCPGVVISLPR